MTFKKLSNSHFKKTYEPWITDGILNSINWKDILFIRYVKTKNKTTKTNSIKNTNTAKSGKWTNQVKQQKTTTGNILKLTC